MDASILKKTVAMAVVVSILVAMMYLFALGKVAESSTSALAHAVDLALGRSLDPYSRTTVELVRSGPDVTSPRTYTVDFRPAPEAMRDARSIERLCVHVVDIVAGHLTNSRVPITIRVIARSSGGATIGACATTVLRLYGAVWQPTW